MAYRILSESEGRWTVAHGDTFPQGSLGIYPGAIFLHDPTGVLYKWTGSTWSTLGGGVGSLEVSEVDGVPTVAAVGGIQLDQTDGFVLTDLTGGFVRIDLNAVPEARLSLGYPTHAEDHAARHASGGADAVKLDDLASPDDNTDLNASTGAHGLLPKLGGGTSNFLRADGTWSAPPAGGSPPTGTGFRHVTAGVEDAASKLVENTDVHSSAGILESKLTLNFATHSNALDHSNANDPTADQKAALAGTSGAPSVTNKYVTNADSRNSDARTPTAHKATHEPGGGDAMAVDAAAGTGSLRTLGTSATSACAGNDSRLSDSRAPTAHDLGGGLHNADTLANLNSKISDADAVALAGQIGGTAASPDIRGIRETSGPTLLTLGSVADGQYLVRSGATVVGATGGSSAHDLGGSTHNADTLANLNSKVSDADVVALAGQIGGTAASPDIRGLRETTGPTLLTMGSVPDNYVLTRSGTSIIGTSPSAGGGDNVSVNGTACTDADLDDATPAAPANAINVKWQKDTGTPNNVSANVPYAAPLTVTGGNLTVVDASTTVKGAVQLATDGESTSGEACQSNDSRLSNSRTPTAHDLGGSGHNADTLANLNTKISDADVPALAGQLGGTAASPDVRGIRETSGPTLLTTGTITDGEYLKRVGSTLVSGSPTGGGARTINFIIDGGGSVITTGSKGFLVVDYACTISEWAILGDASGSIVVDVKRATYSGFPTTTSLAGTEKPTLSSAQKGEDRSLTTWTTSLAAGDILEFNVDSASTVKRVTVALKVS